MRKPTILSTPTGATSTRSRNGAASGMRPRRGQGLRRAEKARGRALAGSAGWNPARAAGRRSLHGRCEVCGDGQASCPYFIGLLRGLRGLGSFLKEKNRRELGVHVRVKSARANFCRFDLKTPQISQSSQNAHFMRVSYMRGICGDLATSQKVGAENPWDLSEHVRNLNQSVKCLGTA